MTDDEIMMPVGKPEAQVMAEIHALRAVGDTITAQSRMFAESFSGVIEAQKGLTKSIDLLRLDVQGIDRRLIRVEEQRHGKDIENLAAGMKLIADRTDKLESNLDQAKGAKAFFEWARTATPWLVGLIGLAMAFFGGKPTAA